MVETGVAVGLLTVVLLKPAAGSHEYINGATPPVTTAFNTVPGSPLQIETPNPASTVGAATSMVLAVSVTGPVMASVPPRIKE